jgi:putative transposase
MVEPRHAVLSIRRQCELLGMARGSWYYEPIAETPFNLKVMRRIDELYLKRPYFGSRRMSDDLNVNRKRVQRLMRLMDLEAIYPKPRTTVRCPEHKIYPYLLRNLEIVRPNQVWSTDITYIPLRGGFVYLTAVLDWYSRYVLAWRLSNSLDGAFCLEALQAALEVTQPEIFNTDQGVQFTSVAFTSCLEAHGIAVSMDGRGRALDNVFVERLWRTVKYEEVYLKDYDDAWHAEASLHEYFTFYCHERRHQSLDKQTPAEVYGAHRKSRTKRIATNIPR